MNKLIEFNVPGGRVLVESQDLATGNVRGAGFGELTEKVGKSFEDVLSVIRPVAEATLNACGNLLSSLDTVEVEFGLKLTGTVDACIAKSSAEGHLHIKLVLKPI